MGGRRCPMVAICSARLVGCQYVQSEGVGLELGNEDVAELH